MGGCMKGGQISAPEAARTPEGNEARERGSGAHLVQQCHFDLGKVGGNALNVVHGGVSTSKCGGGSRWDMKLRVIGVNVADGQRMTDYIT